MWTENKNQAEEKMTHTTQPIEPEPQAVPFSKLAIGTPYIIPFSNTGDLRNHEVLVKCSADHYLYLRSFTVINHEGNYTSPFIVQININELVLPVKFIEFTVKYTYANYRY